MGLLDGKVATITASADFRVEVLTPIRASRR